MLVDRRRVSTAHDILLSMNLAFTTVSVLFLAVPRLARPFIHIEVAIKQLLHMRQTDLVRGYFEYFVGAAILTFCFWLVLRFTAETKFSSELRRSVAGIATTFALPAFWLYVSQQNGWTLGWPYMAWPLEIAVALICVLWFLYRDFPLPKWLCILLVAGHYAFWFLIRGNLFLANSAGPIAPILGFLSTLAWGAYVTSLKQVEPVQRPT